MWGDILDWGSNLFGGGSDIGPVASGSDYADMLEGGGGFFDDLSAGDIFKGGVGLYNSWNKNESRNDMFDSLRQGEQQRYDQGKEYYDAYSNYLNQSYQVSQQNAAARQQAAAAMAAARRQEFANKLQAMKKATKTQNKALGKGRDLFAPLAQALAPQVAIQQGLYNNMAGKLNSALDLYSSPQAIANQGQPAFNVGASYIPKPR